MRQTYIDKSDLSVVNWFERIPYVEAATPRLSSSAEMNMTKNGKLIEETRIPLVGIDPFRDVRASTVHETVSEGTYVFSRNSIVLGSNVADDLGGAEVGDSVKVLVVDRWGKTKLEDSLSLELQSHLEARDLITLQLCTLILYVI